MTSTLPFSKDFFVLIFMAIALIVAGRLIAVVSKKEKEPSNNNLSTGNVLIVFGIFYIGYIIWQLLHIFISFDPDIATMASLVVFTVFGLVAYFTGMYGHDMARRTYGVALLSFVVIRLLLVDVWHMELFGRVITFFVIGVLLMSTAFFTKRNNNNSDVAIIK